MKKILQGILAVIVVLFPIACTATYIIHLEDGRSITVDKYWEEGDQIKFSRGGGIIGIEKNSVLKIEQTEAPADLPEKKETTAETEAAPASDGAKDATKGELSEGRGTQAEEKFKDNQESKSRKESEKDTEKENKELIDKYMKEFDLMKEKFKQVPVMTNEGLRQFVDELLSFRKRVFSDRLGRPFSKQILEVYSMVDEIKATLKFRGY